jgi:hypothetical protein
VTNIFILLCASALAGLAIGLVFFRAEAIMLASPFVALLAAALLHHHGFGLVRDALILVGSLTALQGSYLLGACMRYLTMDDGRDRRDPISQPDPPKRPSALANDRNLFRTENRRP